MNRKLFLTVSTLLFGATQLISGETKAGESKPIVIAHRGASGYLPEHTLEAKALAYGMGADYIEQDVVLTKDDQPIVLHDIHLDTVTDVAEAFPARKRGDGRFYAIDFTLAEIKTLRVHERIDLNTGKPVYAGRFPLGECEFRVPTLTEEVELIRGLNKSTGRHVGIYPEIKKPAWHRQQGKDISRIVLTLLERHGYRTKEDPCFLQCFDPLETRRLREELGCKLRLVQLIADDDWDEAATDFEKLRTADGVKQIAEYADAVGPWMPHIVTGLDGAGRPQLTDLVNNAHALGLAVHPFTFRADSLPDYADSFEQVLSLFIEQAKVDGVFTDFPDRAVRFMRDR